MATEQGLSLSEVSRRLGVSRSAVRDWRDHGVSARRSDACPPRPRSPSYAALLGYYLGDGCVSQAARTCTLRVSCDRTYPGIIADVTALMTAVHPQRPVHHVRAAGVVVVQSSWKHWPCLFPQHGPGRKHERTLVLEDWQREVVSAHPGDFLRGLFHSDGSRVRNWATRVVDGERRRYDYPRWQFSNRSEDILRWCGEALDAVEVPWRRSGPWTVSVSRRDGVRRLDDLVGCKS